MRRLILSAYIYRQPLLNKMTSSKKGDLLEYSTIPTNKHDVVPLIFLKLVLQSAFIPNTKQLSTLMIAKAGLGKTIKLDHLRKNPYVYYTVDITPKHFIQFLSKVHERKKKYLVIPDYIITLGHAKKTKDLLRGHLRAMMEEGCQDNDAYGLEYHFPYPIKGGLISAITPEYFASSSKIWKKDGFLSRFLPFSYSHSPETTKQVLDNIRNKNNPIINFGMKVRTTGVKEPVRTEDIDNQIRLMAYEIAGGEPPYRPYLQMISLCNSSAVLRESLRVEKEDIELIRSLLVFINRKETPI